MKPSLYPRSFCKRTPRTPSEERGQATHLRERRHGQGTCSPSQMLTRHRVLLSLFSTVEPLFRVALGFVAMAKPRRFVALLAPELSPLSAGSATDLAFTMTRMLGVVLVALGIMQGAAIGLASPNDANLIGHVLLMSFIGDMLQFGIFVIHGFQHSHWTPIPWMDGWHRPTHIGPFLAFFLPAALAFCRYTFMSALGQRVVTGLVNYPAHLKPLVEETQQTRRSTRPRIAEKDL